MPVSSSKGLSNSTHVAGNSFFSLGYWPDSIIQKWGCGHNLVLGQTSIFTSSIVSLCAHLSFRLTGLAYILHVFVQLSKVFCVIFTKQRRTFCVILLNKWEHFVSYFKHFLNNCNQILHTTSPDYAKGSIPHKTKQNHFPFKNYFLAHYSSNFHDIFHSNSENILAH